MQKGQEGSLSADPKSEKLQRADWDPYLVWQKRIKDGEPPANPAPEAGEPDQGSDAFSVWKSLFRRDN